MAHKGFLRVAMTKKTKKGGPFVSVLIGETEGGTDGEWYSIFDAQWFGGTENKPSQYDIRPYASKDNPAPIVYTYTTSGDYKNILAIRPADEQWIAHTEPGQILLPEDADKDTSKATETKQSAPDSMTGRQMIAQAVELLVDGIALVVRETKE